MVSQYSKWVFTSLEPVPPLFQRGLDCQELPVPHIIVTFRRSQFAGVVRTGVQLGRTAGPL